MDGGKVLAKLADNPFTKRARSYSGRPIGRITPSRPMCALSKSAADGDAGVVAQRYSLILFGNHQRLELQSWQPETARTVLKPFAWKAMSVSIEAARGACRGRQGAVLGKAWPREATEPAEWRSNESIRSPICRAARLLCDATNEVFFDNLKVTPNQ